MSQEPMNAAARFVPSKVPTGVHPLVKQFFVLRNQERAPTKLITKRAGLGRDTIAGWAKDNNPTIANFDAALRVLGYRLEIRRIDE